MVRSSALVMVLLALASPTAGVADEQRVRTDLSEEAHARLFVVPVRIQPKKGNKPSECAELGPQDLGLRVRKRALSGQALRELLDKGAITLDRRPRPMLHAVVVDTSGSMSLDLPQAKAAASGYFERNLGDLDKAMVVSFDDSVTLRQRITAQKPKLLAAVSDLEVAGQTSLFDALVHTIRELDTYRGRPVIVLISDGQDNASFYDAEDVIEELEQRSDLTVFAIGIGQRSERVREMLRRIASSTFGTYFDVARADELGAVFHKIREILEAEATLSIVDPDPNAGPGEVQVKSKKGACEVLVLGASQQTHEEKIARTPITVPAPPLPMSFKKFLSYSHRKVLADGTLVRSNTDCFGDDRSMARRLSEWEFEVTPQRIRGCAPDIAMAHGYLYDPDPDADPAVTRNESVQVKVRSFDFEVPSFESLEEDPIHLIDAILASIPDDIAVDATGPVDRATLSRWLTDTPILVHGTTFLEMRPRLAQALVSHPAYGDWAMGRLGEWIEQDIHDLEARYRQLFPGYSDETVRAAAQSSDDAVAIRARLKAPTEVDLQPFLAAWLGDIESHTLFARWEREAVRRRLAGNEPDASTRSFLRDWRRLRRLLARPSTTRIIAPLVLMYESDCDCVGFYRIVLPRPGFIRARMQERSVFFQAPLLDLPPKMPFGYAMVGALQEQLPEVLVSLRDGGYRLDSIGYELLGPTEFHDPERAFSETRVYLDLVGPDVDGTDEPRRVNLVTDLHLSMPADAEDLGAAGKPGRRPRWLIDAVKVDVRNDPEIKRQLRQLDKALAGYELLRGSASRSITDLSPKLPARHDVGFEGEGLLGARANGHADPADQR